MREDAGAWRIIPIILIIHQFDEPWWTTWTSTTSTTFLRPFRPPPPPPSSSLPNVVFRFLVFSCCLPLHSPLFTSHESSLPSSCAATALMMRLPVLSQTAS